MNNKKALITKKLFSRLVLPAIALFLLIGSCKKSSDLFNQPDSSGFKRKSGGNIPVFTTASEINEHLKWIARGLAHWAHPDHLVRRIDSLTNIPGNDSNMNAINYLNTEYGFDSAHDDSIDAHFPGNTYDSDGLGAFEIDNEPFFTKIYIPNNYYWASKPFVIVPEKVEEDSNTPTSLTGYFYKTGGGIDSVTITDVNEENYHIWVVDYFSYKDFDEWYSKQGDSLIRKSGKIEYCQLNGVCEPREIFNPYCADCWPVIPQRYRLEITEIELFTDNCPHAEKFFGHTYDFGVSYGLEDGTGISPFTGYINDWHGDETIKRIKRKEVCREKCGGSGTKGNNCPSHVHHVGYVLYEEMVAHLSPCKVPLIFFEKDRGPFRQANWYTVPNYTLHTSDMLGGDYRPWYRTWQAAYVTTVVDVYAMWQANNHNGSSIIIGNNEAKIKIELIKL
jgi:hypothetical protein